MKKTTEEILPANAADRLQVKPSSTFLQKTKQGNEK
jgi:hypothetical protein